MYSKENKRKHLILSCRFYNGEEECPFQKELKAHEIDKSHLPPPECMKDEYDIPAEKVAFLQNAATFFYYEKMWIERVLNCGYNFFKHAVQEYEQYKMSDFAVGDGTPKELKAFLFNRYNYWGGHLEMGGSEFRKFYTQYYQTRATNRERRAEQRRPKLISKCRYYKGEKKNPYEGSDIAMFWTYEESWVTDLSKSYRNGDAWKKELTEYLGEDFNKNDGVPQSLKGLLLNRYLHWCVMGNFDKNDFINWYYKNYLKSKSPLD